MKNRICICLAGTYWFLYGGVLFAGIDTLAIEGVEIDSAVRETSRTRQRDWLERVAKAQRGRYRFFVVFQHYPSMSSALKSTRTWRSPDLPTERDLSRRATKTARLTAPASSPWRG